MVDGKKNELFEIDNVVPIGRKPLYPAFPSDRSADAIGDAAISV